VLRKLLHFPWNDDSSELGDDAIGGIRSTRLSFV
jgi:hypothetical protein